MKDSPKLETPPNSQILVVLDTSALRADGFLRRDSILRLRAYSNLTGARILIPSIVERETVDLIADRVRDGMSDARSARQKLLQAGTSVGFELPAEKSLHEEARSAFQERLDQLSAVLLPMPGIAHETVLERIQSRRKPFSSSGEGKDRGYKDYLLWQSVVDYLARVGKYIPSHLVFVSGNVRDFASEQGSSLHADLLQDLHDIPVTTTMFSSIRELLSEAVTPELETSVAISAQLETADVSRELREYILAEAEPLFVGRRPYVVAHHERRLLNVLIESVRSIDVQDLGDIYMVEGATAFVEAQVEMEADLIADVVYEEADWTRDDYGQLKEEQVWETAPATATVTVEIQWDGKTIKPTSVVVETLEVIVF